MFIFVVIYMRVPPMFLSKLQIFPQGLDLFFEVAYSQTFPAATPGTECPERRKYLVKFYENANVPSRAEISVSHICSLDPELVCLIEIKMTINFTQAAQLRRVCWTFHYQSNHWVVKVTEHMAVAWFSKRYFYI